MRLIDADLLQESFLESFEEAVAWYEETKMERAEQAVVTFLECLLRLKEQPIAEPRWIPASEKLPTDRDWCLGVFKEKSTGWVCIPFVCEYLGIETSATTREGWTIHHCTDEPNKFGGDYFKELTCVAWMPLPEPYEERREDNGTD